MSYQHSAGPNLETSGCLGSARRCCKLHSCAEVGGVLLGHQETPATLDIDDYVWFHLKHGRTAYISGSVDIRAPAVSDPRRGLLPDESGGDLRVRDQESFSSGSYFRDPTNVGLLIDLAPAIHCGILLLDEGGCFLPSIVDGFSA